MRWRASSEKTVVEGRAMVDGDGDGDGEREGGRGSREGGQGGMICSDAE